MKELLVAARRAGFGVGVVAAAALWIVPAQAAVIGLFDWGINIDGTTTLPGDPIPGNVDDSGFDFSSGLGTIEVTISGAGGHTVDLFVDHEIDEVINTFFNESGAVTGVAAAGQSWEIDEPGFVFGDIYGNFLASTLDNTNAVPAGSEDDVSMAMGWDFTLAALQTATIDFVLSETIPGGFYLTHTDPDSQGSIYFSSALEIASGPAQIPEPGALSLLGLGALAWGAASRRRRRQA